MSLSAYDLTESESGSSAEASMLSNAGTKAHFSVRKALPSARGRDRGFSIFTYCRKI